MLKGGFADLQFQKEILIYENTENELKKLCKLINSVNAKGELTLHRTSRIEEAYHIVFKRNLTLMIFMLAFGRNDDAKVLDLIQIIKKTENKAFIPIILVTKEELNLRHFLGELHCFGILDTEYEEEYAVRMLQDALRFSAVLPQKEYTYFKKAGEIRRVRVADILYTEHQKNHTVIHTVYDSLEICPCSCRDILSRFDSYDFILCARGKVVNMMSVERINIPKRRLYFAGGEEWIEYGKMYGEEIQKYIMRRGLV